MSNYVAERLAEISSESTEVAVVESPPEAPTPRTTLVAVTPGDMLVAQHQLLEFVHARQASVDAEFKELSEALESAVKNGWATKALRNALNKVGRRVTFYQKMKEAVEDGYVLMPALPMDVIAIRTKAMTPRADDSTYSSTTFEQTAQSLPCGQGEYKNPKPTIDKVVEDYKDHEGKDRKRWSYFPIGFQDDLEMPVELCKPELLDRTRAAMAKRLFDEIGVVRDDHRWGRRGDPMVIGTILDPTRRGRRFAFFLAWALPLQAI